MLCGGMIGAVVNVLQVSVVVAGVAMVFVIGLIAGYIWGVERTWSSIARERERALVTRRPAPTPKPIGLRRDRFPRR